MSGCRCGGACRRKDDVATDNEKMAFSHDELLLLVAFAGETVQRHMGSKEVVDAYRAIVERVAREAPGTFEQIRQLYLDKVCFLSACVRGAGGDVS